MYGGKEDQRSVQETEMESSAPSLRQPSITGTWQEQWLWKSLGAISLALAAKLGFGRGLTIGCSGSLLAAVG